jgi:hypothetical protein
VGVVGWYTGMGRVTQRSLQDVSGGAVGCLKCLVKFGGGEMLGGAGLELGVVGVRRTNMGRVTQRSLQDDFHGAVACLKGLVEVRGMRKQGSQV